MDGGIKLYIDQDYIDNFFGQNASEICTLTDEELAIATKSLIDEYAREGDWNYGIDPGLDEIITAARRYYPND